MPLAVLDIVGNTGGCGKDCQSFIDTWDNWCRKYENAPLALLDINTNESDLDRKSRYMIRKAHKCGYTYDTFDYNEHLDEIHEINISKSVRQGKPMTDSYTTPPVKIGQEFTLCDTHQLVRMAGFQHGIVRAYSSIAILNELAIVNTIIGHGASLSDGVMNGLIHAIVTYCQKHSIAKYLNYLTLENSLEGLANFKRSVGFKSYNVKFIYGG